MTIRFTLFKSTESSATTSASSIDLIYVRFFLVLLSCITETQSIYAHLATQLDNVLNIIIVERDINSKFSAQLLDSDSHRNNRKNVWYNTYRALRLNSCHKHEHITIWFSANHDQNKSRFDLQLKHGHRRSRDNFFFTSVEICQSLLC